VFDYIPFPIFTHTMGMTHFLDNHSSLVAMFQWLEGMFCFTLLLWSVRW